MKKKTWIILAVVFIVLLAVGSFVLSRVLQQGPPITKSVQVTLEITLAPDFTPVVSPDNIITPINRTVAYNISAESVNGFVGDVMISFPNLPEGVTASFFPSNTFSVSPGSSTGIQANIIISDDANLVGTHILDVTFVSTVYN